MRHRDFRGLWLCGLAVNLTTWMLQVGAAGMMSEMTASPLLISLVQAALSVPSVIVGLPAGVFADLADRRRLMLTTQAWQLAAVSTIGCLAWTGQLTPTLLLVMAGLSGLGYAFQAPAFQSVIGEVVPHAEVPAALALGSVSFNLSRVAGPAIAGVLIAATGSWSVCVAISACFAAVLWRLRQWRGMARQSVLPNEPLWHAMVTGLRYARHAPALWRPLVHLAAFAIGGSALWALLPVAARQQLGWSASGFSLLFTISGLGGVLAVLVLPQLRHRFTLHHLVVLACMGYAGVLVALSSSHSAALTCLVMPVAGICWVLASSSTFAAVQTSLPSWVRARGVSIHIIVYYLCMAAGACVWGWVAQQLGIALALQAAAVSLLAGALLCARLPFRLGLPNEVARAGDWPRGDPERPVELEEGPVIVQFRYLVRAESLEEFCAEIPLLHPVRMRNGARAWRLFRDPAQVAAVIERYVHRTWGDYLRSHERATVFEQELERRLCRHLAGGEPPVQQVLVGFGTSVRSDDFLAVDVHALEPWEAKGHAARQHSTMKTVVAFSNRMS